MQDNDGNPPPIAPSPHDHQITAQDLICFARAELHDTNVICSLNQLFHDQKSAGHSFGLTNKHMALPNGPKQENSDKTT